MGRAHFLWQNLALLLSFKILRKLEYYPFIEILDIKQAPRDCKTFFQNCMLRKMLNLWFNLLLDKLDLFATVWISQRPNLNVPVSLDRSLSLLRMYVLKAFFTVTGIRYFHSPLLKL